MSATPEQQETPITEEERPLAGEIRPDEPTPEEVARAVNNEPDPQFPVKIGEYEFLLSDLTSEDWLSYVSAFLPPLESAVKDLTPLIAVAVRAITVLKNMNDKNLAALKVVAQAGDYVLLSNTLQKLGISADEAFDVNTLEALIQASKIEDPKSMDFLTAVTSVFFKPLIAPAAAGFHAASSLSFSTLLIKIGAKLPDLAFASVQSAIIRSEHPIQSESDWRINLKKQIALMDGFDQFEIVSKQFELYQKGGKPRNFFVQIIRMIPIPRAITNTSIETLLA